MLADTVLCSSWVPSWGSAALLGSGKYFRSDLDHAIQTSSPRYLVLGPRQIALICLDDGNQTVRAITSKLLCMAHTSTRSHMTSVATRGSVVNFCETPRTPTSAPCSQDRVPATDLVHQPVLTVFSLGNACARKIIVCEAPRTSALESHLGHVWGGSFAGSRRRTAADIEPKPRPHLGQLGDHQDRPRRFQLVYPAIAIAFPSVGTYEGGTLLRVPDQPMARRLLTSVLGHERQLSSRPERSVRRSPRSCFATSAAK